MDDSKRTGQDTGQDTDAILADLVTEKPNRHRTVLVHPDIAEALCKNHADAERMIRNMP